MLLAAFNQTACAATAFRCTKNGNPPLIVLESHESRHIWRYAHLKTRYRSEDKGRQSYSGSNFVYSILVLSVPVVAAPVSVK